MHYPDGSAAVMRKQTVSDRYTVSCCHLKSLCGHDAHARFV